MTASFRTMIAADRQFVISGWSSSYRVSDHAGLLSMVTYADVMHREIARIIDHPTTRTIVAEEPGETDEKGAAFLYGFIVHRVIPPPQCGPYVYYVYVKKPYRRGRDLLGLEQGYGRQLLAAAGIDARKPFGFACFTSFVRTLGSKIPLAEFNPLPARYLGYE